jgi:rhodanese-related sulfurtransferase
MERPTRRGWARAALSLILAAIAVGCGDRGDTGHTQDLDRFEMTRVYVQTWLSEMGTDRLIISAADVKEKFVDDWENQKGHYQIVSVRAPDDYARAGHIPNAINMYWVDSVTDENLARLDSTRTLILYCYYGHGSMISSTILNLLGYRCRSLDFGMMGWNLEALVKQPWDRQADDELEIAMTEPAASYPLPVLTSRQTEAASIILEMARKYFAGEGSPVLRADDVHSIVDDWDRRKAEYQLIDVRSKEDYHRGHVPHSFNIPWVEIAAIENLQKLDPGRTIIVCSENGQTGQLAATVLNLLSYHAVNMLFGMMDWNITAVASADRWAGAAGYPIAHEE